MSQNIIIWQGVYPDFSGVPQIGSGFDSPRWLESLQNSMNGEQPKIITQKDGPFLPFIESLYRLNGKLGIVDFGGGMGLVFRDLMRKIPGFDPKQYSIVEGKKVCQMGKSFWGAKGPLFCDLIDQINYPCDCLLIRSTLQYLSDWRGVLIRLLELNPQMVFLEDVPVSLEVTFATGQNYYESVIPYWFFNEEDILQFFKTKKYSLSSCGDLNPLLYKDGTPITIPGAKIASATKMFVFTRDE